MSWRRTEVPVSKLQCDVVATLCFLREDLLFEARVTNDFTQSGSRRSEGGNYTEVSCVHTRVASSRSCVSESRIWPDGSSQEPQMCFVNSLLMSQEACYMCVVLRVFQRTNLWLATKTG